MRKATSVLPVTYEQMERTDALCQEYIPDQSDKDYIGHLLSLPKADGLALEATRMMGGRLSKSLHM